MSLSAEHGGEESALNRYIGMSLTFGFTIMLIIDQGFLIYKEARLKNEQSEEDE